MKRWLFMLLVLIPGVLYAQDIGGQYYVAHPDSSYLGMASASDSNDGSYSNPWATWGKGFSSAGEGDTVYFRGGIYREGFSPNITNDNTSFFNYPSERPIMDFGDFNPGAWGLTINVSGDTGVHIKGIEVQNIWEPENDAAAFNIYQSSNILIENCKVRVIGGAGFVATNCDSITFLNCDAYACIDSSLTKGKSDGFRIWDTNGTDTTQRHFIRYCRSWHCRDDGVDTNVPGYVEMTGNWMFCNQVVDGGGAGLKWGIIQAPGQSFVRRKIQNNICLLNIGSGFSQNDNDSYSANQEVYNNTSVSNGGHGFRGFSSLDTADAVYRNNISYDNDNGTHLFQRPTDDQYNSWNLFTGGEFSMNDFIGPTDSISLITVLTAERKIDGSLPNFENFNLIKGSILINAGVNVGLPYYGDSPDIGYSESNYYIDFKYKFFKQDNKKYKQENKIIISNK